MVKFVNINLKNSSDILKGDQDFLNYYLWINCLSIIRLTRKDVTRSTSIKLSSRCVLVSVLLFIFGIFTVFFFPDYEMSVGLFLVMVIVFGWGILGRHIAWVFGIFGITAFMIGVGWARQAVTDSDVSQLRGRMVSGMGVIMEDASLGTFSQRVIVNIFSKDKLSETSSVVLILILYEFFVS